MRYPGPPGKQAQTITCLTAGFCKALFSIGFGFELPELQLVDAPAHAVYHFLIPGVVCLVERLPKLKQLILYGLIHDVVH